MFNLKPYAAILFFTILSACAGSDIFSPIGNNLSDPLMVAVDAASRRAYLVNSNNSYKYDSASLHSVDLSNPAAPVRMGDPISIPNFSGEIKVDIANQLAFVSNRLSSDSNDTTDSLLKVDLNSTPATVTSVDMSPNPFGLDFDSSGTSLVLTNHSHKLEIFSSLTATPTLSQTVSLTGTLSDGAQLTQSETTYVEVIGERAYLIRARGGLLVVNLDEIGVSGANPIDYFIDGIPSPRGIKQSADGSKLYVLDVFEATPMMRVIDLTLLPVLSTANGDSDQATIQIKAVTDIDGDIAPVTVGSDPNQIIVNGTTAYVSNYNDDTLSIISNADTAPTAATEAVGDRPFGMALYEDGAGNTYLLVCNAGSDTLSIIDITGGTFTLAGTYSGS